MFQQRAFKQIVSEVCELLPYVRLKIPASPASVQKQMGYLTQAQTKLATVQEKTAMLVRQQRNSAKSTAYQVLAGVVQELTQDVKDLKLLAEEYPVDPEGTVACLESWKVREVALLRQIDALKAR
jgi:hypothetical protein